MWPFKTETRASDSLTDLVLAGLAVSATGSRTAPAASLGAVEAAAGLWGRSFASATLTPATAATAALTPAILARIGRALLLRGEALFELRVEAGRLQLVEAVTWDISGGDDYIYRADFSTPSGTVSRTLPASRVLHPRINTTAARPWQGESPLPRATAALAATLESQLTDEVKGAVGGVIPVPAGSLEALQKDINRLAGRTVLVETTSGGLGDMAGAPRQDWKRNRIGGDPPSSLIELRREASAGILAAAGCPLSLLERSDGTHAREELRRFAHTTIEPVAQVVAGELADKLAAPGLAFDFGAIWASDLQGRARSFASMVKAGMPLDKAAALAGLLVDDGD